MKRFLVVLFVCMGFAASLAHAASCGNGVKDCACGDTLVTSYALKQTLTCNGNGLTLTNGATLTCGNFSLVGTNQTGTGITIPSGQKGIVQRCKGDGSATKGIRNFKVGLYCDGCRYSKVTQSLFQNNGVPGQIQGYNVQVTNAYRFQLQASIIKNAGDEGVHVSAGSKNAFLSNRFIDNDTEGLYFLNTTNNVVASNKFISEVTPLYIKNSPGNLFRNNTTDGGLTQFIGSSANNRMFGGHYAGLKLTKTTDGTPSTLTGSYVHLFRVGGAAACVIQDNSGVATLASPIVGTTCSPLNTCTGTCSLVVK